VAAVYVPRSPTTSVLYGVVRANLAAFVAAVDAETDGGGLPGFVLNEFRKFLRCGVLSHGFCRVRCGDCAYERLVPFSCKARAVCTSCGGRRMMERALHLVDRVLPADVPVRQWVLSVPHRLRYRLAYDHRLCRIVLRVFVRALRSAYRRQARRQGLAGGETGMVTSIQRFGGAVNAHLHFHTIVLDGLFVREPDGTLRFHPAAPPTDEDVSRVVARVRRRLERLGLAAASSDDEDADPLADESPALAGLSRAAILGRAALGPRAGRGPERIGADPDAPWVDRHVPLHAHDGGFDLHAAVHVEAGDRQRLERLCQYLCRPPLGQGRLKKLLDGRVAVVLQRPWADGTTHLVFTPLELLQRLVPRPRINMLLYHGYHGVVAPNAPWRREVVARAEPEATAADSRPPAAPAHEEVAAAKSARTRPKYRAWSELMRRAFEADVLACPRCGGRMTVLATIEDPAVIHRILMHLGLSTEAGEALPAARASP
jgi:hypothetical protein